MITQYHLATLLTATELVLSAAITGTRCVAIGPRVRFGGRRRSWTHLQRGTAWRRAAWRKVSRTQPVQLREHLLVSPDHGHDDAVPKVVEFLVIHLEAWPHFAKRQIPPGDSDPQLSECIDHADDQTRDRGVRDLEVPFGVAEAFDNGLGRKRFRVDPAAQGSAKVSQCLGKAPVATRRRRSRASPARPPALSPGISAYRCART